MKGRAFIDGLRARGEQAAWEGYGAECALLADAVEEADESYKRWIDSETARVGDGWHDTNDGPSDVEGIELIRRAISYLDRRGLIERKEGEPHLIRVVEEAGE